MELKHKWMTGIGICLGLLIVPYGIETDFLEALRHSEAAFNRTLWN